MPSLSTTIQAAVALAERIRSEPVPNARPLVAVHWEWLGDWPGIGPNGIDHDRKGWGKAMMVSRTELA